MSRQYFRKFMPEQSINPAAKLSTTVAFNINSGKNDLMHFSNGRAFLLIKSTLMRGDSTSNNQIVAGDVRRTWNWPAGLFQTSREKLNGSTFSIVNNFTQTDSILKRQRYSKAYLDTVGQLMALNDDLERTAEKNDFRTVDTVFIPACMSTFGIKDLQPSSSLRLEFDTNTNYRTSCVEHKDVGDEIEHGVGNDKYWFNIDSIELYVLVTESAVDAPKGTYAYDLVEFKSQIFSKDFGTSVNEIVKVEPSVQSIFYALQHKDALSTTRWSPTKFQPFSTNDDNDYSNNAYNKLKQQYIRYNGINYPENMNDFSRDGTDTETGYKLGFYMNLIYNELLWNGSGSEGYNLFKSSAPTGYGPYFAFDLEKDASVQATDVNIVMKFEPGVTNTSMIVVSSNTFTLQVAYDDNGNLSGVPVKTIQ